MAESEKQRMIGLALFLILTDYWKKHLKKLPFVDTEEPELEIVGDKKEEDKK